MFNKNNLKVIFIKHISFNNFHHTPNVKHRLKHLSPASNTRAAGRRLVKRVELITHK